MKNLSLPMFLLFLCMAWSCSSQTKNSQLPKSHKTVKMINATNLETITLGAGCFWCVEAFFEELRGVSTVVSGYSGGHIKNPSYREVCAKTTGHAEVVQISYDKDIISLEEILEVFWTTHDPTTLNRQGNDVGPQYRSAIYFRNEAQKKIAEQSKQKVAPTIWDAPIVTEITKFSVFYEAEKDHQGYYKREGDNNNYCTYVITPKMQKFRKRFKDKLKKE